MIRSANLYDQIIKFALLKRRRQHLVNQNDCIVDHFIGAGLIGQNHCNGAVLIIGGALA